MVGSWMGQITIGSWRAKEANHDRQLKGTGSKLGILVCGYPCAYCFSHSSKHPLPETADRRFRRVCRLGRRTRNEKPLQRMHSKRQQRKDAGRGIWRGFVTACGEDRWSLAGGL